MRYLIKFSYDGTNFFGYQKQPGKRTIEGEFEKALFDINNHTETRIFSSGRTDAGVHALEQVAHFDLTIDITLYKLKCALNSLLPDDIHVISTEIVDKDFHARYMVKEKIYRYIINCGEYNPIKRNFEYQYNKELDYEKMEQALNYFLGEHDFKSFVSEEVIKDNYVRTITETKLIKDNNKLIFEFKGTGFMKYQVRNMVGTLIKIGKGKLESNVIEELLASDNNRKVVTTAPSCGLYLVKVEY